MGNWRTVHIIGTCAEQDIPALRKALDPGLDYSNFHPLVCGGIFGLRNWAMPSIDAKGNLAERDYDAEDVAQTLEKLAKAAPSLTVKVHCGGDYEDTTCVATVTLVDGKATVGTPEVKDVGPIVGSEEEAADRVLSELIRSRRRQL